MLLQLGLQIVQFQDASLAHQIAKIAQILQVVHHVSQDMHHTQ